MSSNLSLLKRLTILLVEDDEELRDGLSETLSIFFNKVIIAKNGIEALEILAQNKIDMIITDYVMPLMDGEEFSRQIRINDHKIPISIISNYSEKEKLMKLIDLELTSYLLKPISYNDLMVCLKNMIKKLEKYNFYDFEINSDVNYNFSTKEIINDKKNVVGKLSKSEIVILELLIKNTNAIISIETIQSYLSLNEVKSEQAIKNIIYRLRKKIGKDVIQNSNNLGYSFKKQFG